MIRGLEEKHEHAAQRVARDTRPLGTRVAEFLAKPQTVFVLATTSTVCTMLFMQVADVIWLAVLFYFWFLAVQENTLPFRLPKSAKTKDYNDLIPGTARPKIGGGIAFYGNDRRNNEELWFTNDDMRTHTLIFGSTGSGKTVALVSIAFNSLLHGSGFIYVDGKGDNSLFANIFSMVRGMGRDDDMLLINFMTGARDVIGPQTSRLSNTMNPFSSGSSSMLSQLVVSLMDASSAGAAGGDMWKGRAINFVESLMRILCAMRDAGHILLDANSIRDFFILEKLEMMVVDKKFPVTDDYSVSLEGYPPQILEPLKSYILNLPGYNPKNKGDQAGEVREQHGFITMQLTRVFGSLADTYGHILRTNLAEVDLKDVVLNRRILVVLLPALEKSPEELSNLGKIIIASLKAMMAAGLGDAVEGDYRDVILRKPTNATSPYMCIMDEYGYYAVQGFAVVPAQARSLGFSAIFAGQDLPAFQKASKEEAASIGANCNIKICMKLEDPQETWEFFNRVAGETYVTNVSGFQVDSGSMSMNYLDSRNANVDRRQRIEILDLKDQREGEAHIFFKSKIIRAEMFYANPKPVKKMRINHFLKVESPPEKDLQNIITRLNRFKSVFTENTARDIEVPDNEDIRILSDSLLDSDDLQPFERGVAGLIAILEHEVEKQKEISAPYEMEDPVDAMSIFSRIPVKNEIVVHMIGDENVELFSLPMLRKGSTLEELKHIEILGGNSAAGSEQEANKLIAELKTATAYPPDVAFIRDQDAMKKDVSAVIRILGGEVVDVNMGDVGGASGYGGSRDSSGSGDYNHDMNMGDGDSFSMDRFLSGSGRGKDLPDLFPKIFDLPDLPELETERRDDDDEGNGVDDDEGGGDDDGSDGVGDTGTGADEDEDEDDNSGIDRDESTGDDGDSGSGGSGSAMSTYMNDSMRDSMNNAMGRDFSGMQSQTRDIESRSKEGSNNEGGNKEERFQFPSDIDEMPELPDLEALEALLRDLEAKAKSLQEDNQQEENNSDNKKNAMDDVMDAEYRDYNNNNRSNNTDADNDVDDQVGGRTSKDDDKR